MKPFVSINMATSLDGKIATELRGPVKLGSAYDSRRMSEIRSKQDVVINGAGTFKAHPYPLHVKGMRVHKQPVSAIVSSRLQIPPSTPWENATKFDRWVFCGKNAPISTIKRLQAKGVRVLKSTAQRPSPNEILAAFANAGFRNVLLEGGGEFNASFIEKDLVDRIYLTFCPVIVGGAGSPTFVEGKGFPQGKFPRFRLRSVKKKGHELYLVYER